MNAIIWISYLFRRVKQGGNLTDTKIIDISQYRQTVIRLAGILKSMVSHALVSNNSANRKSNTLISQYFNKFTLAVFCMMQMLWRQSL